MCCSPAKFKLKDGSTSDYYAWCGSLTCEPTLLTGGIGSIQTAVLSPTTTNLGANEVANLIAYCRGAWVGQQAARADVLVGNAGAVSSISAAIAAVT